MKAWLQIWKLIYVREPLGNITPESHHFDLTPWITFFLKTMNESFKEKEGSAEGVCSQNTEMDITVTQLNAFTIGTFCHTMEV